MAEVVNTWEKGWNQDNQPLDQPKGTYRNMFGMNLITKNGDNYSAETQQGTIISFSIPNYVDSLDYTFAAPKARFTPIGFFSFVDKLVVMATNDETATGGAGMIGVVTIAENGIGTWDTLYYDAALGFTKRNRLDGYALNETTNINRVYWCDDLNLPRVVNYTSTNFSAVTSGTLVNGQQYTVVQGQITYNGNLYGIGETLGPTFTANATTVFTPTVSAGIPTAKVINYVSVNSITIQPPAAVGDIDYVKTTFDGSLYAGMKAYTYRLKSLTGKVTTFGPVSKPIHVTNSVPSGVAADYQAYEGLGQRAVLVQTTSAITIRLSDLPYTDFDMVEVVAIEYDQKIEVIRSITKIAEANITLPTIEIKHLGQENLATFTVDDLTAIETIVISAKAMTTFKMRGFMANLKENAEFTDPVTATITPFLYQIPSDNTGGVNYHNTTYFADNSGTPAIAVDGKYRVDGVGGSNIEYPVGSGTFYVPGDVFVGVANEVFFTSTGGATAMPIIRIQKYSNGAGSYKDIEINDEYWDYKGQAIHHYLGGYWRDETYRIGFLGFDKYRQPFFVRWLDDIPIPAQSDVMGNGSGSSGINGAPASSSSGTGDARLLNVYAGPIVAPSPTGDDGAQASINVMGLTINSLTLTPEIVAMLDSFAIVRCPRDKTILTQGLLFPTVMKFDNANAFVPLATYDSSVDSTAVLRNGVVGEGGCWPDMFTLKSPEIQSQNADLIGDLTLKSGDILEPVASYTTLMPYTPATVNINNAAAQNPIYSASAYNESFFSKWYYHRKYTGGPAVIQRYSFVEANATITAFDGSSDFVNNSSLIANNSATPPAYVIHPLTTVSTAPPGTDAYYRASGGRCGLFWVYGSDPSCLDFQNPSLAGSPKVWTAGENQKLLTNWVRPKSVVYGGQSELAKSLSEYIYCGHIQKVDAQFKADTLDTNPVSPTFGKYVVNGIQVFGGDCLVNIYDNVGQMYNDSSFGVGFSFDYGIHFPCEMVLDSVLRQGRHFANQGLHIQTDGVTFNYGGLIQYEAYSVNSAYSTTDGLDFKYPALPIGNISDGIYPARTRWSQVKTIGETIDNQRIYLPNNYRDVDTNHGQINNIKVGVNRLFYWQDKGVGYLPVDERQLVNAAIGGQVQLGVGGILDRFDNMDIYFGNQHQWGLVERPDGFDWFDMRRKEWCFLNLGGQSIEYSTVKGVSSFFNNRFTAIETMTGDTIFNSDQPIMGRGISGWYDSRFKTVYLTFKLTQVSGGGREGTVPPAKYHFGDFTVGVSKPLNVFIGQHPFVPGIAHEHNNHSLSVITNVSPLIANTNYVEGDLVSYLNVLYVCLQDIAIGGVVVNPPDSYTGYFTAISKIDEINVHWRGDTAKFYGRVYDSYIEIVVTGQGESVSFDNYEAYGNEFNFSDVLVNSQNGSGLDANISTINRNYRYYDGSWKASYPLTSTNSRFNDKYIIVRFNKKNNVDGDITTSLNQVKRLLYLKSVIRLKK